MQAVLQQVQGVHAGAEQVEVHVVLRHVDQQQVAEVVAVGDNWKTDCPLCEKELFSSVGKGCKLCAMPIIDTEKFCCDNCELKYKIINRVAKEV